jgi:RHS repeat-associated protein
MRLFWLGNGPHIPEANANRRVQPSRLETSTHVQARRRTRDTHHCRAVWHAQRLDISSLLYYNARMYDPLLARFISADTVVPGSGPLTLAPLDAVESSAWASGGGAPANPQDLNRYAYTLNKPLNATDPSGHWLESAIDIASIAYDRNKIY